ncbi:MAG: NAD-dependent protein deacylase [Bacilli bacterium]|nr:NAD-dependent protein deacylase [Bacilli bacterium]
MDKKIEELLNIIKDSKRIVFMTGAGVSVPSGIPDFRSANGLYSTKYGDLNPETIISHSFFVKYPDEFYRFYRDKMVYENAKPNVIHTTMALLESCGKSLGVITQNIDGLHQMGGSKDVLELHGTILKNRCMKCGKEYGLDKITSSNGVPMCDCGGIIKPEVVLYEEGLDYDCLRASVDRIIQADTLIVVGTSLVVNPAASLVSYFGGNKFIIITMSETPYDKYADLIIRDKAEIVFDMIRKEYE